MQNLNLYQVERPQQDGPQPEYLLLGLGLLLLLCLGHAVWQGWQLYSKGQHLRQLEAAAQTQEAELTTAQASFVEPKLDARLPRQLADQESQNRQLQGLITYLQTLDEQQRVGFAAPLQALAEQHPPGGLWLMGIQISDGGSQIRLQGRSRNQELLPRYLDALGASPVFSGREFARMDIQRGEDQVLEFDLSSRPVDQEPSQ